MSSEWKKSFLDHVSDIPAIGSGIHYTQSADRLRRLLREGPLKVTDLRNEPECFFAAHALLSSFATQVGPGFGIRFTVQFNLFCGTILGLGNPDQVAALEDYQREGKLGCFCLTERLAGVNSGLVVDTTATWDEGRQQFLLHCPDEGSRKNWISQGLTADLAVTVATLIVNGKSKGPHAFIMELRRNGKLMPGVGAEDMGDKTIGNDLDNARISFDQVWLPKSALLDRYCGIEQGEYVQRQAGVANMDMIGQRLYTGRAVIAGSTLVFARTLYRTAREYTDKKNCWNPKGATLLSDIPQLKFLYEEADQAFSRVECLRNAVESRLCECLRSETLPDADVVQMIAAYKVKAIETAISFCFRLKQELGSYALMGGTGFEKMDYLQCCKFAEGDSRILMQKIARDRLQAFSKNRSGKPREVEICSELGGALMKGGKKAWDSNWRLVYDLADAVIEGIVDEAAATPASRL
jgi:acyl-CoA oxidase